MTSLGSVDHLAFWEMLGFEECFEFVRVVCGRGCRENTDDDSVGGDLLVLVDKVNESRKLRLSVVADGGVLSSGTRSSSSSGITGRMFFSSSSSSSD